MSIARSRLLDLMKVQCKVFSTTFNPEGIKTGNKILRQRLKGRAVEQYYPRRVATVQQLEKEYRRFGIEAGMTDGVLATWDEEEEDRIEHLRLLKARGKGAPKKKRTVEDSKQSKSKKK